MDFLLSNHFVSTKVLVHIITLPSRLTLSRGATDRCITSVAVKKWLGKDIIVKAANKPFFCGIVTNIELHRDGSDFGCIQVSGYSSTYRNGDGTELLLME